MADIFFFTDLDALASAQTQAQAFGPVPGDNTSFRVSNQFLVKPSSSAIAVTDGIPFVQQCKEDEDCVNVILLPINNPDFDFPTIKFFVYRGIQKDTLFDAQGTIREPDGSWKPNNILKVLHDLQDKINADNNTQLDPKSENIGYHYSVVGNTDNYQSDDEYLERVIFKKDTVQLPLVTAGCQIGKFIGNTTSAGFQIIQDRLGYEPKLGIIRSLDHIITVTSPLGTTKTSAFKHWHDKEAILTYVDPAAFYGCAKANGEKVKAYTGQTAEKVDSINVVEKFYNKEVVYIDIRNDQNYSYDYYDSFGKTLRLSFEQEGSDELLSESLNYYTDWPILRLESKKLPVKKGKSKIFFELPFVGVNDDSSKYYLNSFTHEFLPKTGSRTKFHHLNQFDEEKLFLVGYSEVISLLNWVNEENNLGSNYFLFKYSALQYAFCDKIIRNSIFDTLFSLDMKLIIDDGKLDDGDFNTYLYSSINAPLIDKTLEKDDSQDVYLANIGIAKDKNHITFFAFKERGNHNANGDKLNYPMSLIRKGKYDNSVFLDEYTYDPTQKSLGFLAALPKRIPEQGLVLKRVKHPFPQNGQEEIREFLYYLKTGQGRNNGFNIDLRTLDCLTITLEEYENIKQLKETKFGTNYSYRTYIQALETDFHINKSYRINEMQLGIMGVSPNDSKEILEQNIEFVEGNDSITLNGLVTKN
ncbi:hypothetical protein M0D21_15995 [Aquimarina sp. D1M17]|uniref:hypothetical protein n=1 Tax=Aquimarina acroporae TaxID=2937283 RepID=UPI0020C06123|nr:hypothetical protein [Aquimarina acroporae]MCK8523080.1 hypothetical protein [Aquimarina acroporae]